MMKKCDFCGKTFSSSQWERLGRKYCSFECYMKGNAIVNLILSVFFFILTIILFYYSTKAPSTDVTYIVLTLLAFAATVFLLFFGFYGYIQRKRPQDFQIRHYKSTYLFVIKFNRKPSLINFLLGIKNSEYFFQSRNLTLRVFILYIANIIIDLMCERVRQYLYVYLQ